MKIASMDISSLSADPANVRSHGPRNVDAIVASLRQWGQQRPIVVNGKGVVVCGNGTLAAAQKMGWDKVDVVRTDLTGADAVAYSIADNRTAELAEWDTDLAEVLAGLQKDEDFDHLVTGFTDDEIAELIAADVDPGGVVEDEAPEPPEDAITKQGDLWLLGEHQVLCGDATKDAVCEDGAAAMVWTDPPYGVSYVGKTADAMTIDNDGAEFAAIVRDALARAFVASRDGAVWYVAAPAGPQFYEFATVLRDLEVWRQTLVWVKDSMVLGHSDFHYRHEVLFYGWKNGRHKAPPTRTETTVWDVPRPKASREHPTMKPVALVGKAMELSSRRGDLVYDPFLGSGTTLIAAEQLARKCYGLEIDPRYVDVICKRWHKLTGKAPTLEDGTEFPVD